MDAFAALLGSGSARLRQLYAARMAAANLCRRGDAAAAIAALQSERDAALEQLRIALLAERSLALRRSRQRARFRAQPLALRSRTSRPDRKRRAVRPSRPGHG